MTQLEYFKAWAKERYPGMDQSTDEKALKDGTVLFLNDMLQIAWRAFQYRYTIRPTTTMANSTFNKEEFRKDDPATIVDRLRGIYNVPVEGQYKPSVINLEAARRIEALQAEVKSLEWLSNTFRDERNRLQQELVEMNSQLVHCGGVISKGDAEIERLKYELDVYKGGMRSFATVEELMEDLNSPD